MTMYYPPGHPDAPDPAGKPAQDPDTAPPLASDELVPIEAHLSLLRDDIRTATRLMGLACIATLLSALVIVAVARSLDLDPPGAG